MPILPSNSDFMQRALIEGRRALPDCRPNPPVGCVLVREHQVISQGHTQPPGQAHAEAMALAGVSASTRGVTAYVTLEPCAFHGRTPSCAQALIDAGVVRVFVGMLDPDPRNAGAGVRMLRQAGVEVIVGLLADDVSRDLRTYLMAEA